MAERGVANAEVAGSSPADRLWWARERLGIVSDRRGESGREQSGAVEFGYVWFAVAWSGEVRNGQVGTCDAWPGEDRCSADL